MNIPSTFSDFIHPPEEFALLANTILGRLSTNLTTRLPPAQHGENTSIPARVMLLSSHGASTLGQTFRRPIMSSMGSFEGSTTLALNAMRATMPLFRNGRAMYVYYLLRRGQLLMYFVYIVPLQLLGLLMPISREHGSRLTALCLILLYLILAC